MLFIKALHIRLVDIKVVSVLNRGIVCVASMYPSICLVVAV